MRRSISFFKLECSAWKIIKKKVNYLPLFMHIQKLAILRLCNKSRTLISTFVFQNFPSARENPT